MNKVMYEVWGEDTFARESYLVGTFKTREKAGKALEASEKSVLDQCEELRSNSYNCRTVRKGVFINGFLVHKTLYRENFILSLC